MSWVRLRQVALVAHDLSAVVDSLSSAFGLAVAHRDPGVAAFGLENAVLPVGSSFLEVVAPVREGTAAGRQLARLGGDGGYMVICHTDDHDAVRARLPGLGVRAVVDTPADDDYRILQLHPSDTGGSFLEIDFQPGGSDADDGPWMPAGPSWQAARQVDVVRGLSGVTVQSRDPAGVAARWSAITGCDVVDDTVLQLDGATMTFVPGDLDALVGVQLVAAGEGVAPWSTSIGGVRFDVA